MDSKITIEALREKVEQKIKSLPVDLQETEILNDIILEIYNGWPGSVGQERVIDCIDFISKRIPKYALIMDKTNLETLTTYAKARSCNYTNWFQNCYLPDLNGVIVLDTVEDFKQKFPSGKFVCPCCNGVSTDYQECNSGKIVKGTKKRSGKVCDWKVFGLFGDLGKGIRVIVKDRFSDFPKPIAMFKPIEMAQTIEEPIEELVK